MGLWAPVSSQEAWLCGGSGVVMDRGVDSGTQREADSPFLRGPQ